MSKHRTHGMIWYRLRRGVSGLLCLVLLLGILPQAGLTASAASGEQSWAMPYMEQLVDWGVMRGDVNGNLSPNRDISRAEFVTLINRAYGYDELGGTPFTDINYATDWFAEDIDIAYNMGYFNGTSATTASPRSPVTREQAAVLIARNMMLQSPAGESLGFSDSRSLSDWSRGLVAAAALEGMINGYADGSFRPKKNITRGEAAAMLVRVIGTPINTGGNYSLGDVYGNVTISSPGVSLRNTTIAGNLYLTGGIGLGDVLLENVNVLGRIVVSGAGESSASQSSVILRNVEADELVVDSIADQFVTIRAEGITDIDTAYVRTNAYIDDSSIAGYGLKRIELAGDWGTKLQLAGSIKEVVNRTPGADLQINQGTAEKITMDEYGRNSTVLVDKGTKVDEMNLDVSATVNGSGDIKKLNVGAAGSTVEILPDTVVIRPGITADIAGSTMDSVTAAEASAEPKLLAGFPSVRNIAPQAADGVYSTNKSGTVYWGVSSLGDGSVSEEDLIANPVYGGNIFKNQAGSFSAESAQTEYAKAIASLDTDGSYYLSAIMVDDRGRRSPLKVVAFTTPDDSTPAFATGYPQKTRETTQRAQVTVMTTKSCLLYYALLPAGSTAPTVQEFKSGNIPGNWGYGSVDATKNVTKSINVNRVQLQEKTDYDLFLWLTDYNGAKSSNVTKLTFNMPDETPPIVGDVTQTVFNADSAGATFSMNEAPSTLFWAIVAEGDTSFINPDTADLTDRRYKIKVESGTGAINSGSANAATANLDTLFNITKLAFKDTQTNNFTLWYVGKDAAGNYSEEVQFIQIRTLDTTPPTVSQEFSSASGDSPLADSSVTLVFSEGVQSGNNGETVLEDLYTEVQAALASGNQGRIAAARQNMADVLAARIQLYTVPRDGRRPTTVAVRTADVDAVDANGNYTYVDGGDWTIDWRYAEIEMKGADRLELRLPAASKDSNPNHVAIKLESGVTYYFHTEGIYDNAITPNALEDRKGSGVYDLPRFRTVYAQIILSEKYECGKIPANETLTPEWKDLRLDMCFDMMPTSTNKAPESDLWDMIMQTDTTVSVEVYRQVWDENGNLLDVNGDPVKKDADGKVETETWECLNVNGEVRFATSGGAFAGMGMGAGNSILGGNYGLLSELKENYVYRYGIHFTRNGTPEGTSKTKDPTDWRGVVQMKFSVIAGPATGVSTVSGNVRNEYKLDGMSYGVSVISEHVTETNTEKELLIPRTYTDTRPPEFSTGSPTFTTTHNSIQMELSLKLNGTIRYVIAPAMRGLDSSVDGKRVTPSNDGSTVDNFVAIAEGSANESTLKETKRNSLETLCSSGTDITPTYIPLNGLERDWFNKYIAFTEYTETTGAGDTAATTTRAAKEYSAPTLENVLNARGVYSTYANVYVGDPVTCSGGATVTVTVDKAKWASIDQDTEYYIYFLLENTSGDTSGVVQCYRTKTKEAKPPIVSIASTQTAATVTSLDPDDNTTAYSGSVIYRAFVDTNSLPAVFNKYYYWGTNGSAVPTSDTTAAGTNVAGKGVKYTVLQAMMERTNSGRTYFDEYAGVTGIEKDNVKLSVYNSITNPLYAGLGANNIAQLGAVNDSRVHTDFAKDGYIQSNAAEYVLLAIARSNTSENNAESYGYAAARGFRQTSTEAPEFTLSKTEGPAGRIRLSLDGLTVYENATDTTPVGTGWGSRPGAASFYFSGNITISFDKPIYQVTEDNTYLRKAVLNAATVADPDNAISIKDFMYFNNKDKWSVNGTGTTAAQTFTLHFDKIQSGEMAYVPAEGRIGSSNTTGNASTKMLTLTFTTGLTNQDYDPTVLDAMKMIAPTFTWTWQ